MGILSQRDNAEAKNIQIFLKKSKLLLDLVGRSGMIAHKIGTKWE
jgi:hypothetical protein